ncbi:MAG: holo-ACP synthase [Candidatus Omnitrophica bacterium]|nr:holo-ACP synthase [Candidatus Omnitrophota bacterium]
MPFPFEIGTDIVSVSRMREAIERQGSRFLNRIFTKGEQDYCSRKKNKYENYAARFAAKEAVIKAKGGGKGRFNFHDIEVKRGTNGKPYIFIGKTARRILGIKPTTQFLLTMAHEREFAVATVAMSTK